MWKSSPMVPNYLFTMELILAEKYIYQAVPFCLVLESLLLEFIQWLVIRMLQTSQQPL
jgi:hypothetical protein